MNFINSALENALMMFVILATSLLINEYAAGRTAYFYEEFITLGNIIAIVLAALIFPLYDRWLKKQNQN